MQRMDAKKALRQQRRVLRGELRAKLRAKLRAEMQASRQQVAGLPMVQEQRLKKLRRKRIRRVVLLVIALLLASLIHCPCAEGVGPTVQPTAPEPAPLVVAPTLQLQKPLGGTLHKQRRAPLSLADAQPLAWLDALRLQVGARSPRLAECFRGTDKPGAVRWSALVNPASGAVTDHEFEIVGQGADVLAWQNDCLVGVLTEPAYRLRQETTAPSGESEASTPVRVSVVLEF